MGNDFVTCVTCGAQYKVCKHCRGYESWRSTACSPRCYQVSQTINEYFYKKITARQAKDQLDLVKCGQIASLTPNTKKWVDQITSDAKNEWTAICVAEEESQKDEPDVIPDESDVTVLVQE